MNNITKKAEEQSQVTNSRNSLSLSHIHCLVSSKPAVVSDLSPAVLTPPEERHGLCPRAHTHCLRLGQVPILQLWWGWRDIPCLPLELCYGSGVSWISPQAWAVAQPLLISLCLLFSRATCPVFLRRRQRAAGALYLRLGPDPPLHLSPAPFLVGCEYTWAGLGVREPSEAFPGSTLGER